MRRSEIFGGKKNGILLYKPRQLVLNSPRQIEAYAEKVIKSFKTHKIYDKLREVGEELRSDG